MVCHGMSRHAILCHAKLTFVKLNDAMLCYAFFKAKPSESERRKAQQSQATHRKAKESQAKESKAQNSQAKQRNERAKQSHQQVEELGIGSPEKRGQPRERGTGGRGEGMTFTSWGTNNLTSLALEAQKQKSTQGEGGEPGGGGGGNDFNMMGHQKVDESGIGSKKNNQPGGGDQERGDQKQVD